MAHSILPLGANTEAAAPLCALCRTGGASFFAWEPRRSGAGAPAVWDSHRRGYFSAARQTPRRLCARRWANLFTFARRRKCSAPAAVVAAAGGFVGITAGQFAVGVRHELLEHGVKGLGLLGRGVMGGSGGGARSRSPWGGNPERPGPGRRLCRPGCGRRRAGHCGPEAGEPA